MKTIIVAATLSLVSGTSCIAQAAPGSAPAGEAIGEYYPATGQIILSISGVNLVYVEDIDGPVMTGDEPLGLPVLGGVVINDDNQVGQFTLSPIGFTDLNLGTIAEAGLVDDGSLKVFWNLNGSPFEMRPLVFVNTAIPEPSAIALATFGLFFMCHRRRILGLTAAAY